MTNFKQEDLNLYVIKPLDLEASAQGYKDTVCHNNFCCEFYVKAIATGKFILSLSSSPSDLIYLFTAGPRLGGKGGFGLLYYAGQVPSFPY